MSKKTLVALRRPVDRAMVFVCQKCGKRAGGSNKDASYELASSLKRATKGEFSKDEVRVVLTSCMKICPSGGIATCVQMQPSGQSTFMEASVEDPEGASEALLERIRLSK
jgi:predicted metal-binding protein